MKKFKYRALKSDGSKFEGNYEANSEDEVIRMISSSGSYPLKIEEVTDNLNLNSSLFDKVKTKDLAIFCRQFYSMIDAGLPIVSSLDILANESSNRKLRNILSEIRDDVKKGETLSDAMKKHKEVFPKLLTSMVESGEMSGNIDEMFLRMSVHFEKENKTNSKVKAALTYPMVIGVVAILAVGAIMIFVMPIFVGMFEEQGVSLPLITRILIGGSNFLTKNIILVLLIIIGAITAFNIYKKSENGILVFSSLKLKVPILKELNKKVIVSRFTRTLATLVSSGVSLVQCLPIVASVLENKIAEDAVMKVRERVVKGEGLSGPISEFDIFPKMLSSMIRIGEESGSLDDILNKTADFYEDEVEQTIQTVTSLLEPLMIVLMGLVVGTMVLAIIIPMFNMYGTM